MNHLRKVWKMATEMKTIVLHDENGNVCGHIHHWPDWTGNAYLCQEGSTLQLVYPGELLRAAACSIALNELEAAGNEKEADAVLLGGHTVRSDKLKDDS